MAEDGRGLGGQDPGRSKANKQERRQGWRLDSSSLRVWKAERSGSRQHQADAGGGVKIRWLQPSVLNAATDQVNPVLFAWQLWEDGGALRVVEGLGADAGVGVCVNWCCDGRLFCPAPYHGAVTVLGVAVCASAPGRCRVWTAAIFAVSHQFTARQSLSRAKAPSIATSARFPLDAGFFFETLASCNRASPSKHLSTRQFFDISN